MTCRSMETDIAVIGAGPAGLAAATAARTCGCRVLIVDAFSIPGGQYFMQPLEKTEVLSTQAARGQQAITEAESAGVEFLNETEIFAAYPGFKLYASGPDGPVRIECQSVIVATGAHDRTVAFPGWTLPGVMTAGAGQRMAKVNGVIPGKRIVIAGSGPFLFAVAESLISKGASIAAVIEARKPRVQLALHLARYPERWAESWNLMRTVRRHAGGLLFGRVVTEAFGRERVDGIRIATLDYTKLEEINDIDTLLISYGFQPSIDVTCILGIKHRFDDGLGGWFVEADPSSGQTSVARVFAAGEVMGVAGAKPAVLSGELAGLSAASAFDHRINQARINSVTKQLRRARKFGHGLGQLFSPPPQLANLARDDTVLCRCEEVTLRQIREACADGARSAYGSKIWTRAGMGRCQGRICRMGIAQILARETGRNMEEIGFNAPRVPIRPTPLANVFSAMDNESQFGYSSQTPPRATS